MKKNDANMLQFDTSEKAISLQEELAEENIKMPFNYIQYLAEQINKLPKGFVLHASRYNTDDNFVIHFWNDSGNSWDIYLEKSACE